MTDPHIHAGVNPPQPPEEFHMPAHLIANAKAYAALVGAICTGLLGVYAADTTVGQALTVVSIVATAVVTWRVPNAEKRRDTLDTLWEFNGPHRVLRETGAVEFSYDEVEDE